LGYAIYFWVIGIENPWISHCSCHLVLGCGVWLWSHIHLELELHRPPVSWWCRWTYQKCCKSEKLFM
jgi:hypothetical protein